jgi:hypothetical protein
MLYVYNKNEDRILSDMRAPKSIFFEHDRNTIIGNNKQKSSHLEDIWYKLLDDKTCPAVKNLREEKVNKELLNDDNLSLLHFYIISLFWRIPLTDFTAKNLIERAEIVTTGRVTSDEIKNDEGWNKVLRSKLYAETIDQCLALNRNVEEYYSQLSEFEEDIFIIGDNPMIFHKNMGKFTDFATTDYCIALSSNRILRHSFNKIPDFKKNLSLRYNAYIINQSKMYVASGNLKTLKKSIENYKKIKALNLFSSLREELFERT